MRRQAKYLNFSGFGYMWGGCFADHGVLSGNGGFEVKFVEALEFTDDDPALLNNSDPKPVSDKTSSEPNKTGEDNTENPTAKESDAASDEVEEISSVSKTESSICRFGWTVQETVKKTKIKTSAQSNLSEVLVLIKTKKRTYHHVHLSLSLCLDEECPRRNVRLRLMSGRHQKILNFRFSKIFSVNSTNLRICYPIRMQASKSDNDSSVQIIGKR